MRNLDRVLIVLFLAGVVAGSLIAQIPSAPQNLVLTQQMSGAAVLKWDTSGHAFGYRVYKSVNRQPFDGIGVVRNHSFVDFFVYPRVVYHYYVTALNLSGESEPSDTVTFPPGPPPSLPGFGLIKGLVTDESTGTPIDGAVVQFFEPFHRWKMRFARTDTNGNFVALLDSGKYVLLAEKAGYLTKWYDNVYTPDKATLVTLNSPDTVTVDFSLTALRRPVIAHVSGTVMDTSMSVLKGAYVAFLRTPRELLELEHAIHLFGGLQNERFYVPELGHLHGVVWLGRTDSLGNYTASVPEGLRYAALVFKPGYDPDFFNGKRTPFDADRILVTGDTSGIDFALVPRSVSTDSIAGTVVDSTGAGITSHVMLVRLTANGPLVTHYRMTDSLGNFTFNHVYAGHFLLKAVPVDGYHPAWYSASSCGVSNYHHADTLTVPASITGLQVCVGPDADSGFTSISGGIQSPPTHFSVQSAATLTGVTVYAVSTTTGQIVAYDVTDPDGSFSLENLPPDTYTLLGDKEGYSSDASSSFVVSQSNFSVTNASLSLSPDVLLSVSGPRTVLPGVYRLEQNYPNPFNPTTDFGFRIANFSATGGGLVSLKIYDMLGREVATFVNEVKQPGEYSVRWDATKFPSGVYFYRLTARPVDGGQAGAYTDTKKMLLMK